MIKNIGLGKMWSQKLFIFILVERVVEIPSAYEHDILATMTCNTNNCIYYWFCANFGCKDDPYCQYIGIQKEVSEFDSRNIGKSYPIDELLFDINF